MDQQTNNSQNFNQINQTQQEVPNSTAVLVLGILSLVFCGLGPILGTIALAISGTGKRSYQENPTIYKETSYNNLKAGRICGLIGLIIGSLIWLFYFTIIIIGLTAASRGY